ncbi:hypothetical protein TNCV_1041341 [Trichonephila clavipes]|nr:hypothetical protein TNCV_1041341 [Trichonephila clavipes]
MILRLLEQIDVSRMVDIDILIQIWKNRVKKIDFVLKWLSRVGSEVGPTKEESEREERKEFEKKEVGRGGRGDPGERRDERSEEEKEKSLGEITDGSRTENRREEKTGETDGEN